MKNLKRVLSLGLASVMLLGMMVMGASAADFTDAKDIKNTEAVNMMVALNVINGKGDGSYFDPSGLVTRAEMAKMITMILFGGEEPALAAGSTPKFSDVPANHWARKYIEYCAGDQLKIIAGMGDGKFAPDANITGTQAAKMALVALGYNAQVYGFEGNKDWEININYVANSKDANLYAGLKNINPSEQITRDQAAKILYNALHAYVVKPEYTITNNGIETAYKPTTDTMLKERFENITVTYGILQGAKWDKDDEEYDYTIGEPTSKQLKDGQDAYKGGTASFTGDVSGLFMQKVEIVSNGKEILGIGAADGAGIMASGTIGKLGTIAADDTKVKIDGTNYTLSDEAQNINSYAFNVKTAGAKLNALKAKTANAAYTYAFDLVDQDGDGKGDVIVTHPFTVAKVGKVTSKTVTINNKTLKLEDVIAYDGIAKDDYVMVTAKANTAENKDTYTELATSGEGKVSRTREGGKEFQLDGEWYTLAASATDEKGNSKATMTAGEKVTALVVVNGYVFVVDSTESKDEATFALLIGAASNDNTRYDPEVKLLFADGTQQWVTAEEDYTSLMTDSKAALVAYEVNDDGNYELTAADAVADANTGFDETLSSLTYTYKKNNKSTVGGNYIDEDAVVFVSNLKGTKYSVITGAELATLADGKVGGDGDFKDEDNVTVKNAYANEDAGTNDKSVAMAFIVSDLDGAENTGDTKYGYVVSKIETALKDADKDTSEKVAVFTIFDGEDTYEVTTTNKASDVTAKVEKGDVIEFAETDTDRVVKVDLDNVHKIADDTVSAITVYSAARGELKYTKNLTLNGDAVQGETAYYTNITKDTVILAINTADTEGVIGGEIALADKNGAETKLIANAVIVEKVNKDGDHEASLIIYCDNILNVKDEETETPETPATVTLGTVPTVTSKDGGSYTLVYSNATPKAGEKFSVTVTVTTAPQTDAEAITVTYNGTNATLTVGTDGNVTGTAEFTAAEGKTEVTASI